MGSEADDVASVKHVLEDRLYGKGLENVHTSCLKPSTATPSEKEWLNLCNLDFMWLNFYTPFICTFPVTALTGHSLGSVVQHLKDSLADALVLFYPLAGRVMTKDGPPRIHCNDAGVVFTEASVDVELADLRMDDFVPVPLLSGLAAAGLGEYPILPKVATGLPAFIVQVTHFKCGGITLAANWAHAVADGQSGLHFMKSWSEVARGADREVSLLPDHRRDLVQPRNPLVASNPFKASAVSAGAQFEAEKLENPTTKTNAKPRKTSKITTKVVEFTKEEIAKLKQVAMEHDVSVQLTRADCMSAHLWPTIARARNLPSSALARLWVLVEGRKKLSLPAGYFGNVVGMITVVTTVGELLKSPLGSTANLIHTAISSITGEWFQDLVDWIQTLEPGHQFAPKPLVYDFECGASYLIRFPYYELDFGFGIPAHSMRNTIGAGDGLLFVLPSSRNSEHMVAMVNLDPEVMSRFISIAHDIPE